MINPASINALPANWSFTPVNGNKCPIGDNWLNNPFSLGEISEIFGKTYRGRPVCSVGLITGKLSGVVGLDIDGPQARAKLKQLTGLEAETIIGSTFSVTSGKPGRSQSFFSVPEQYHPYLATQKIQAGPGEQLEIRWNGCQSVVYGHHPETGSYQWLTDPSQLTSAPEWLLVLMTRFDQALPKDRSQWSDRDYALSYLQALKGDRAVNYDQWLKVGMALHSVDPELYPAWDLWSMQAENYGKTEQKWQSFRRSDSDRSVGIGSLYQWAKEDGYKGKSPKTHQAPGDDSKDLEAVKSEIDHLLKLDAKPCPTAIFPDGLVAPIAGLAKRLNLPCEVYLASLLSVSGSLLNPNIRLIVNPATNQLIPAIFWLGLVGDSGTKKTPVMKALIGALEDLQAKEDERYENALEVYEDEMQAWDKAPKDAKPNKPKKPTARDYFHIDYTLEGITDTLKTQSDSGSLIYTDELAAFFGSMDAYRGGKGADRQRWLSFYDGGSFKVSRKTSGRVYRKFTNLPILGSIQPSVIQTIMESDKSSEDGLWPRFAWVKIPLTKAPGVSKNGGKYTLDELLKDLYQKLDDLPEKIYRLSDDAIDVWNEWHDQVETRILKEPSGLLRSTYPKAKERAARIALLSHLITAVFNNQTPGDEVSAQTLSNAIEFTQWLCRETRLLYTQFGICDTPETAKVLRFVERFKGCGWVTAVMTRAWTPPPKPSLQECRDFMAMVVSLGYATDNKLNKTDPKYAVVIKDLGQSVNKTLEPIPGKDYSVDQEQVNSRSIRSMNESTILSDDAALTKPLTELTEIDLSLVNSETVTGQGLQSPVDLLTYKSDFLHSDDSASNVDVTPVGSISPEVSQGYSPRNAIIRSNGKIDVDESKLDLDWKPERQPQAWEPKRKVKPWEQLTKLYLDIETTGLNPANSRVVMIGLMAEKDGQTITQCLTNPDEAELLKEFLQILDVSKPDCLIGHNLFDFDLLFIIKRCAHHGIAHPFKLGDKRKNVASVSLHGKNYDFVPVTYGKTQILDTQHQVVIWDNVAKTLSGYGLKYSVIALGLRQDRRLELDHHQINQAWESGNLEVIKEYLIYDLEDTKLLADFLLPVVVQQGRYVPGLNLQDLAVASPALKAQKIHQYLLPGIRPAPDTEKVIGGNGGLIGLPQPGLFRDVAKIDVASLYPSLMLRYWLHSRKDTEGKFLDVMAYMVKQRLELKAIAKQGNIQADHEQNALKILINGSYGYFGTLGYPFNDMECMALVSRHGRKIMRRMLEVIESEGGKIIHYHTDGVMFGSTKPQVITAAVQSALPDGINIELEFSDCGVYVPKMNSYVIVFPNGKVKPVGDFRKRERYSLINDFRVNFIKLYFLSSPETADTFYYQTLDGLANRSIPIEQLMITRKIRSNEKRLVELGLGNVGDKVSFYYTAPTNYSKGKPQPVEATQGDYWMEFYQAEITDIYREITGKQDSPLFENDL